MSGGSELCKYKPDRGIEYYASGLAGILRGLLGPHQPSSHAYAKEVRKALETLVFSVWDRAHEYIDVIAESNIPENLYSIKGRECFKELLAGLLRRFYETTRDMPVGARIKLMNMVISAIVEMARYSLPPVGEEIKSYVFSKSEYTVSSPTPVEGEEP